jgi:hypothetical protein
VCVSLSVDRIVPRTTNNTHIARGWDTQLSECHLHACTRPDPSTHHFTTSCLGLNLLPLHRLAGTHEAILQQGERGDSREVRQPGDVPTGAGAHRWIFATILGCLLPSVIFDFGSRLDLLPHPLLSPQEEQLPLHLHVEGMSKGTIVYLNCFRKAKHYKICVCSTVGSSKG